MTIYEEVAKMPPFHRKTLVLVGKDTSVKEYRFLLNAVKCNLTKLTSRSTSCTCAVSGLLYIRLRQDSSCSWSIGHCSGVVGVLVSVFLNVSVSASLLHHEVFLNVF